MRYAALWSVTESAQGSSALLLPEKRRWTEYSNDREG